MGVDIDISDPAEAMPGAQQFDNHAAVVVDAKTGGMIAASVMQAGDRHEGPTRLPGHDGFHGENRCADDGRCRRIQATPGRRVPAIQPALASRHRASTRATCPGV
jgi:hypothetical protein